MLVRFLKDLTRIWLFPLILETIVKITFFKLNLVWEGGTFVVKALQSFIEESLRLMAL